MVSLDPFTTFSLLATNAALCLSLWQYYESRKQTKNLYSVSQSLSTRFLGQYPDYLPEISALLGRARREIRIVCPVPIHGAYSQPIYWLDIEQKLEKFLIQKEIGLSSINIIAVFSDECCRRRMIDMQFPDAKRNWEKWCANTDNRRSVKAFSDRFGNGISIESFDGFADVLECADHHEILNTYKGADVVEIDHLPTIYMWVCDQREAVFCIPSTISTFVAAGFWTSDQGLVRALVDTHKAYALNGPLTKPAGSDSLRP